jgi:DNA-binding CsgD family transcriptional regulator
MNLYKQFINAAEKFLPDDFLNKENSTESNAGLLNNPLFAELLAASPCVVGIFNNHTMGYEFISNNSKEILGYESSHFTCPGGMEKVLATFRPEHAQKHNEFIFPTIFQYFTKYAKKGAIKNYVFTTSFQLKKDHQNYRWYMQQIKVIASVENAVPPLSIVFISDITNIKKDEDIDFTITYKDQNDQFTNVYHLSIPPQGLPINFSKREIEILSSIKKGLSSKEIADQLKISEHTVKVHRKNILKKSSCDNMMEVLQKMNNKNYLD